MQNLVWYDGLLKPALTPPDAIFGPVWMVLYSLMAVSAVLVWRQGWEKAHVRWALLVFSVQLFLNLLWSIFFFQLQNPLLALIDLFALWNAVVWTMVLFWGVSRLATKLLIPYLLWITFATYLNIGIVWLNR